MQISDAPHARFRISSAAGGLSVTEASAAAAWRRFWRKLNGRDYELPHEKIQRLEADLEDKCTALERIQRLARRLDGAAARHILDLTRAALAGGAGGRKAVGHG